MNNVIKIFILIYVAAFVSGCGNYKTMYKPVSFKTPDMPYYGASEYCENISERAYDNAIAQSKRNSEADYQAKKQRRIQEAQLRAAQAPSYTTTTNCSSPYSYGSGYRRELNCTQNHTPTNSVDTGMPVELRMADNVGRGVVGLGGYMNASSAENRAFKNCMFDKGYKQVRVKVR